MSMVAFLLPIKTYLPLIVLGLEHLCTLFNKHHDVILAVVDNVYPGHTTDIEAAMVKVREACTVFQNALAALRFVQGS